MSVPVKTAFSQKFDAVFPHMDRQLSGVQSQTRRDSNSFKVVAGGSLVSNSPFKRDSAASAPKPVNTKRHSRTGSIHQQSELIKELGLAAGNDSDLTAMEDTDDIDFSSYYMPSPNPNASANSKKKVTWATTEDVLEFETESRRSSTSTEEYIDSDDEEDLDCTISAVPAPGTFPRSQGGAKLAVADLAIPSADPEEKSQVGPQPSETTCTTKEPTLISLSALSSAPSSATLSAPTHRTQSASASSLKEPSLSLSPSLGSTVFSAPLSRQASTSSNDSVAELIGNIDDFMSGVGCESPASSLTRSGRMHTLTNAYSDDDSSSVFSDASSQQKSVTSASSVEEHAAAEVLKTKAYERDFPGDYREPALRHSQDEDSSDNELFCLPELPDNSPLLGTELESQTTPKAIRAQPSSQRSSTDTSPDSPILSSLSVPSSVPYVINRNDEDTESLVGSEVSGISWYEQYANADVLHTRESRLNELQRELGSRQPDQSASVPRSQSQLLSQLPTVQAEHVVFKTPSAPIGSVSAKPRNGQGSTDASGFVGLDRFTSARSHDLSSRLSELSEASFSPASTTSVFQEESDSPGTIARDVDSPSQASPSSQQHRRSLSANDVAVEEIAEEEQPLQRHSVCELNFTLDDILPGLTGSSFASGLESSLNDVYDNRDKKYKVRQQAVVIAKDTKSQSGSHVKPTSSAPSSIRKKRPSDMHALHRSLSTLHLEKRESTKRRGGQLFFNLASVAFDNLPAGSGGKVEIFLDNGRQRVPVGTFDLGTRISVRREFELSVTKDLTFKLEFVLSKTSQAATPVSSSASKEKRGFRSVFASPKKRSASSSSSREASLASFVDSANLLTSITINFSDISDECLRKATEKSFTLSATHKARGRVNAQMLYMPAISGIHRSKLPQSMDECEKGLKLADWHRKVVHEGVLTQLGGDCNTWRRRLFKLRGSTLVPYNEVTRHAYVDIDLTAAMALEDCNDAKHGDPDDEPWRMDHSFKISFADSTAILFYADSDSEKTVWMDKLKTRMEDTKRDPAPEWALAVLKRAA